MREVCSNAACTAAVPPLRAPSQHLARIHDAVRIECALDGAHDLERDRIFVAKQFFALQAADAMLGAEAAAVARDERPVRRPHPPDARFDRPGHAPEDFVAGQVPVRVVEMLEVVYVEDEQSQGLRLVLRFEDQVAQPCATSIRPPPSTAAMSART